MVPHGVCQCPDGIVKNEQILVLVLSESKHQRIQDECQVRHQLCAGFLLQRGKCAMMSSRETILGHLWQLINSVTTESNSGMYASCSGDSAYLQAASCTRLLLSRIRLSSSVIRGFRYVSGG